MGLKPCNPPYDEAYVRTLVGHGLTPLQVCDLNIPALDRLWVVLRELWISRCKVQLLGCRWAEGVLGIYEKHHPGDLRPRRAIEVARKHVNGKASDEELSAARDAARAAAWAAWVAARAAAWAAARAAAGAAAWAAWDAAGAAAWDAAERNYIDDVKQVLSGVEVDDLPIRNADE